MQSRDTDMLTKLRHLLLDLLITGYTYYKVKWSLIQAVCVKWGGGNGGDGLILLSICYVVPPCQGTKSKETKPRRPEGASSETDTGIGHSVIRGLAQPGGCTTPTGQWSAGSAVV
jgi:hypothetical protein